MATVEPRAPVQPGDRAPDFTLARVLEEGFVSLADYRGRSPVLLGMFRGVYCPFCRRNMALLGRTRDKLQAFNVDALGIIGTSTERARQYFRYNPIRLPLAADPDVLTHQAYGIPKPRRTPEQQQAFSSVRINPTGELPEALPIFEAGHALDRLDGFVQTPADRADEQRVNTQRVGLVLVDRASIIRWVYIEGVEGPSVGMFPKEPEILDAARSATN